MKPEVENLCAESRQTPESEAPPAWNKSDPTPPELLGELVENSQVYVVFLDNNRRIVRANRAFRKDFSVDGTDLLFDSCLTEGAAGTLKKRLAEFNAPVIDLELHHPVSGGVRIVTYRFITHEGGWFACVGIDRSQETEMVSQMAVLIEELEREVTQRTELAEKLEELVITDSLTGVFNRRFFDRTLVEEWNRWERYGSRFGLLLLDIDHFKKINDTHGHQIGDEVLRRLGHALTYGIRSGDTVTRYGGEEFAVMALNVTAESALHLAERLRKLVRDASMPQPIERVTVSVGVVTTDARARKPADLVKCADRALYQAKKEGRDRSVLHDEKFFS